jgi:PAS domain S-box-containing protein
VAGLDKVIRASRGFKNASPAASFPNVSLFKKLQQAPEGFYPTQGVVDGIKRLVSYRKIETLPLIVLVGQAQQEVFDGYWRNRRTYYATAAALTASILFAIFLATLRQKKLIAARSEIHEAQAALACSQERYALVEAAVNDGIWDWNILTGEAYMSPRWKNILGYADEELPNLASSFFDRIHPDDKAAVAEANRAQLEENKPYTLDFRLRCKNGDYRWVNSRGQAVRDASGRPVRMLGITTDITDRKRAEASVAESHNNLERAEAMTRLGHIKYIRATGEYTWSEGMYRIMGKSPASFTPTLSNSLELIHPDDRPALQQYRRDVLAGLEPPPVTLRSIKDDGQVISIEVWSAPLRACDDSVTGMFGTVQDITARKDAAESLARANQELIETQYAIDQAVIVAVTDVKGDITYANDTFCQISGYTREELIGKNHRMLSSGAHSTAFFRDMYYCIANGRIWRGEICNKAKDGSIYWVDTTIVPQIGSDGKPLAYMSIRIDITGRKHAEEMLAWEMRQREAAQTALAQANEGLEARVAERTAELAQEMRRREEAQMTLAQAKKMEAVGQLTAGIAHDFNNLLAVIRGSLGFVEEAAMRGLTADPELIDAALRATRRGTELVQRLLAFSRQSPLKAEPTTIDQLVLDTLRLLQRTLGQGIDTETHLAAAAAAASVDRSQMTNALLNLALNARDAMPEGGQLTIATSCRPAQPTAAEDAARWPTGEEICITVSDTGEGMTEKIRKHAFEPFFTTKPDGLGSGLGLSMVQGFVEQSGGRIEIDSAAGRGTTITIRLPRIAAESRADEADADAGLSARGREKIVLLVEDDPDVRIVTAAQLKKLGYKVHAVANGMEAIDLIASPANIDVTLTDIVLPGGLDGVALVKEAMRARPKMGVLCMSGYDPTMKHRKWLQIQNISFLEKPFSSSRLAQALDAALAH